MAYSVEMMKTKRPTKDKCNICGMYADLTDDHVPPKFWGNKVSRRYSQGFGTYDPAGGASHPWKGNDGIKFKSLCKKCNNEILGAKYDKALDAFCKQIFSNCWKSSVWNCMIEPNKVARAVVGHMLAAKEFYDDSCVVDDLLRKYILDEKMVRPGNLKLLYFIYPYDYIVVARDVVALNIVEKKKETTPDGMISLIYSQPIGFLLTDSKQNLDLPDIFNACSTDVNENRSIVCMRKTMFYPGTSTLRNPNWPFGFTEYEHNADALIGGKALSRLITAKVSR